MDEYQNLIVDHSLVKLKLREITKAVQQQQNMLFDSETHRTRLQAVSDLVLITQEIKSFQKRIIKPGH